MGLSGKSSQNSLLNRLKGISAFVSTMQRLIQRIIQATRSSTLPWYAYWELLYLSLGRRLLDIKEYSLHLKPGVVYFAPKNLLIDQKTFHEIFLDQRYKADYHNAVVVDVGAHKGYFSAYTLLQGASVVFSYEPERHNFSFLQRTRETFLPHDFSWHIYKMAVGNHDGEVDLHVSNESYSHSLFLSPEKGGGGLEKVPMISMVRILKKVSSLSEGRRSVVKLDAEGAECEIILDTPPEQWQAVDEVFVEVHSFAPCLPTKISEHLRTAGFVIKAEHISDESPHIVYNYLRNM